MTMKLMGGVPVFGDPVDFGALTQIQRTLWSEERAVAAAMMADHHLGYAVPIGGVVAYKDAVSPSGVGYDIACFVGDTLIPLLDGSQASLRDLAARTRPFWVYSTRDGKVVPGRATSRLTRRDAELMEVIVSGGAAIVCTPDHQFMMRDGSYRSARELRVLDSLMPLYRSTTRRDAYEHVTHPEGGSRPTHRLVDEYFNGPLPPGWEVHHDDERRWNNEPSNLLRLTNADHQRIHAPRRGTHLRTPEFKAARLEVLNEKGFYAPELLAKKQAVARSNGQHFTSGMAIEAGNGLRGSAFLVAYNQSEKGRAKSREMASRDYVCDCGEVVAGAGRLRVHRRRLHGFNHRVIGLRALERVEDVYCLEVEDHHNFALAAGVFVHNCGNKAVKTDLRFNPDLIRLSPAKPDRNWIDYAMDLIWKHISFGMGRNNDEKVDHELFDDPAWQIKPIKQLRDKAADQLGTVGGGNHYVDLFEDEEGWLWIGVHFGSRGLGHDIAVHYLKAGGAKDGLHVEPLVLGTETALGQEYLEGMRLAGRYAYAGRDWVCQKVAKLLGAKIVEEVHNHHNYAWREVHTGIGQVWVVRKGATPAFPGQRGFIGGSMGDDAVIVEGLDLGTHIDLAAARTEAGASLSSTVHGAGRAMSRTAAKGKVDRRTGEIKSPGAFTREQMLEWVRNKGVELRGADVDESPMAYKRLPEVLAHHATTIRILHTLHPVGVAMAGSNTRDPYRD